MNLRFITYDENEEEALLEWRAVAVTGRGKAAGMPRSGGGFAAPLEVGHGTPS